MFFLVVLYSSSPEDVRVKPIPLRSLKKINLLRLLEPLGSAGSLRTAPPVSSRCAAVLSVVTAEDKGRAAALCFFSSEVAAVLLPPTPTRARRPNWPAANTALCLETRCCVDFPGSLQRVLSSGVSNHIDSASEARELLT